MAPASTHNWLYSLKLSYKGFMLVGFLLVFELMFVGSLFAMLAEAEGEVRKERTAREISDVTARVVQQLYQGGQDGARYLREPDKPELLQSFRKMLNELPDNLAKLKDMTVGTPDQQPTKELFLHGTKALKILDVITKITEEGNPTKAYAVHQKYKQVLEEHKEALVKGLADLKERQERFAVQSSDAQDLNRVRMKYLLIAGVVANIVVAMILCLIFVRTITNRIEILVDHTLRIPKGEPLQDKLPGTDEIAKLDEAFHTMQDVLEEAKAKERELDRMKQEFIAMVSHDLRTPLTAIQGYIQLVADGVYGDLSKEGVDRSARAERNIDRLMRLVNDIIDLNKVESGSLEVLLGDCRLGTLFMRSADAVSVVAEKKNIAVQYTDTPVVIRADEDRLVQVLVNFLGNALKFSPDGSKITIEARDESEQMYIGVTDEGPGIPARAVATLFDRFSQVNPSEDRKKGSGLGLSICKAIVEAHGGTIGVTSEEGKGSTFWFRVPLAAATSVKVDTSVTQKVG